MTVLTEQWADLADGPVNGLVEFWRPDVGPDSDGPGATTTDRVIVPVVNGAMTTPDLDPGPARVVLRFGTWAPPRDIIIPDSDDPVALVPLFQQYQPQPPVVVSEAWQAAQAAQAARDEAIEVAEGIADIGEQAEQVAADKVAAQAARTGAETARSAAEMAATDAATERDAADDAAGAASASASSASGSAGTATAAALAADADRIAAQDAAADAVAARDAAQGSASDATDAASAAEASAEAAADSAAEAAQIVADQIPGATSSTKGGVLVPSGDIGGTWDAMTVPGLADKADAEHEHPIADVTGLQAELDGKAAAAHAHPISDVTGLQAALDGKSATGHGHGIGDVTGLTAALSTTQATSERGQASGYAPLDSSGLVPVIHLPTYEYANLAAFPATGAAGRIYIAADTARLYRWSGSAYVELSPMPASTDAVAEGATHLYYTDARVAAVIAAAFGTGAGKITQGNDSRLSDARTPTAANQVYDFGFVHTTGGTARAATSAGNVLPQGLRLLRNIRITEIVWRGTTADASGSMVVELRKNGAQVSGTSKTIAFGDQLAGGSAATSTGTFDYDAGDVLLPYIVSVGGTPGNGLVCEIKAVTR